MKCWNAEGDDQRDVPIFRKTADIKTEVKKQRRFFFSRADPLPSLHACAHARTQVHEHMHWREREGSWNWKWKRKRKRERRRGNSGFFQTSLLAGTSPCFLPLHGSLFFFSTAVDSTFSSSLTKYSHYLSVSHLRQQKSCFVLLHLILEISFFFLNEMIEEKKKKERKELLVMQALFTYATRNHKCALDHANTNTLTGNTTKQRARAEKKPGVIERNTQSHA